MALLTSTDRALTSRSSDRARSQRKSVRIRRSADVRRLPGAKTMARALDPTASNRARLWQGALGRIGEPSLRVYDCRHAAATTWLRAGVPLGEVARRLGHSVELLVATYVGAIEGDEALANERIQATIGGQR